MNMYKNKSPLSHHTNQNQHKSPIRVDNPNIITPVYGTNMFTNTLNNKGKFNGNSSTNAMNNGLAFNKKPLLGINNPKVNSDLDL